MIRNVYGKAVTASTVISFLGMDEEDTSTISRKDMATVALALRNTQGKEKDEEEALRYVHGLRARCERELPGFTQGLIYNATGSAISLVDCRNWGGGLVSNPYPLRIDNGQWGMFLQKQLYCDAGGSSGALVYQGFNNDGISCYWCIAWNSDKFPLRSTQTNVHVKIVRDVDWEEDKCWESVREAIQNTCPLHKANREGWYSIITASYGPQASFETILTLQHL